MDSRKKKVIAVLVVVLAIALAIILAMAVMGRGNELSSSDNTAAFAGAKTVETISSAEPVATATSTTAPADNLTGGDTSSASSQAAGSPAQDSQAASNSTPVPDSKATLAKIYVFPQAPCVGHLMDIGGSGFAPNANIDVTFAAKEGYGVNLGTATSDAAGNWHLNAVAMPVSVWDKADQKNVPVTSSKNWWIQGYNGNVSATPTAELGLELMNC